MDIKVVKINKFMDEIWIPFSAEDGFVPYCVANELSTIELVFLDDETKVNIGKYTFNYSDLFFTEQECQIACDRLNGIRYD